MQKFLSKLGFRPRWGNTEPDTTAFQNDPDFMKKLEEIRRQKKVDPKFNSISEINKLIENKKRP